MFDHLGYGLSLPERAVRSLIAVAAGATKIVTDAVLPRPLRRSRTYAVLLGNAQRFLIERVGEVEGAFDKESRTIPEDYVPRKVAGHVLEAAGIFSIHLSPLWVFAIAADAAHGSREYLNRLASELRQDGVIDPDVEVKELDDVLVAMGKASEKTSQVFDTPPLSVKDIAQLRDQIVGGYGSLFKEVADLMPRIDTLWERMQQVAGTEVKLSTLAGLMSIDLGKAAGRALGGAFSIGRTTTEFLGETVLASYADSLAEMDRRGILNCMDEATRPYVNGFLKQYSRANRSWTERLLGWVRGRWGGRAGAPSAAAEEKLDTPRPRG